MDGWGASVVGVTSRRTWLLTGFAVVCTFGAIALALIGG